jgi:putative ABC transport system substrate-binding protein
MIRRRDFVALLGGAGAAWALAARAQAPARLPRIGILPGIANDADGQVRIKAFQRRLRELGWGERNDVETDICWTSGDADRIRSGATEMVERSPDVLVSAGLATTIALRDKTQSIPIVFLVVPDPVDHGFVTNLAQPDGNLTGFTNFDTSMGEKWFEILKQIAPQVGRIGLMFDPQLFPRGRHEIPSIAAAAASTGVRLTTLAVHDAADIEKAIAELAREPNSGLIVLSDNTVVRHRQLITSLAARHGLPAIYPYRYFATCGGLVSYGMDTIDLYARAAQYVDRILRGAKVAELPVQHPTKFELVINLKAARALGLDISPILIAGASEVLE